MSGSPKYKHLRRKLRRDATFPERLLWSRLKNKQAGHKFRRQESIGPYIADFFCFEVGLVVEVDGDHHAMKEIAYRDKVRDEYMLDRGLIVLRYSTQQVTESLDGVVLDIMENCKKLKNRPPL